MNRRHFIPAAVLALSMGAYTPLFAEDVHLEASEVKQLLSGNTAEGVWDGVAYKSYFGPDGVTIYDPQNGDALVGKWRINSETGEYESFWDAIGWTSYTVLQTQTGYAWRRNGEIYPFTLVEGRLVSQ
ncbi:hypothetical protein ACEWPM_008505 [Roseovarius sp. S4756]|uniref:hypothetical protein n=1 Tax=Roseovarius maritimus TaxID=3342637 RepID=UPI00372AD570